MGHYMTKLAELADAPHYGMRSAFLDARESLELAARAAKTAAVENGLQGRAGDAAERQLDRQAAVMLRLADVFDEIGPLLRQANDQLDAARATYLRLASQRPPAGRSDATAILRMQFERDQEDDAKEAYQQATHRFEALASRMAALEEELHPREFASSLSPGQSEAPGELRTLTQLTADQLGALTAAQLIRLADTLDDPEAVWRWWASLTESQRALLLQHAAPLLGRLDGLPPAVRIAANRINAATALAANDREIAELERQRSDPHANRPRIDARLEVLRAENGYLEKAVTGAVQLYLYDREASRAVEVIGDLGATPTDVIYFNPGTYTGLPSFWGGDLSKFAKALIEDHPGALVFITKDGSFPGEDDANLGDPDTLRIVEANDPRSVDATAPRLADLQKGLAASPEYGMVPQTAIGHSWGLANITASEQAGAHYDRVISLSGAWMPEDWKPAPDTEYTDHSYLDMLQVSQWTGIVGERHNPRSVDSPFAHSYYYASSTPLVTQLGPIPVPDVGGLMANHSLPISDGKANSDLLDNVRLEIFG